MLTFLLALLEALPYGTTAINAFDGIGTVPQSARAARLRIAAVVILLGAAASLVSAAVIWRPLQPAMVSDILGWAGVGLFVVFVFIGARCHGENQRQIAAEQSSAEGGESQLR
jgi:hypothetical protein